MASQKSKKVKGAVPCGNPQRFESSDVIKMTHKRKALEPGEMESESEKHIKTMVQNQIKVDTNIVEQFSQHRAFTAASAYDPSADKLVGLHGFDQHKQVNEVDSKVEYFRQCGLTEDEILFMLRTEERKVTSPKKKNYGPDPSMEQRWREDIEKKIQSKEEELKKPDMFKGRLELSRQSLDLEKSIEQQQNRDMILPPGMITQKEHLSSHPDDPINHIPEIMSRINPKPEREPRRDRRRRRKLHRQMLRQQLYMQDEKCDSEEDKNRGEDDNSVLSSFETNDDQNKGNDVLHICTTTNLELPPCSGHSDSKKKNDPSQSSCSSENRDSSNQQEKQIKEITTTVEFIPEVEILANRLSLQEILAMEKFKNYETGEPNRIIYVKNLPNDVREEDLVSLFGRYQKQDDVQIIFKLLTGRMKGQAFITFPDASVAGQAISLLNGYKLRDKPIILSYGKKKS